MKADAADSGIGFKVGGFVPEQQPSGHGGCGDAENKEAQPQQRTAGGLLRRPRSALAKWAGPGAGPGAGRPRIWRLQFFTWSLQARETLELKEATCNRKEA